MFLLFGKVENNWDYVNNRIGWIMNPDEYFFT